MGDAPLGHRTSGAIALTRIPLFSLGKLVATPQAFHALVQAGDSALVVLARHALGDWGNLDPTDRASNDAAVLHGGRVLSEYTLSTGERLWVITEGGQTTLLLPAEY